MSYRKFKADHLFSGRQWLDNNAVLITNSAGEIAAIVPETEAGGDIQAFAGILCPGFVNTHCHLELSHLKGKIPERTGMVDFLLAVMKQRQFPREQVLQAITEAEQAMFGNGIVAVGDICNTIDTLLQKQQQRLHYYNFVEATGFVEATAQQRFDLAKVVFDQLAVDHPTSIVPHAPYSVSPGLLQLITGFPGNQLLTIHNQESLAENEFLEKGTGDFHRLYLALGLDISFYKAGGRTSLQTVFPAFLPQQPVILVHNVVTEEADLQFLQAANAIGQVSFCVCPNANQFIGNGLPDLDLLRRYNTTITIGTDSLASNRQLNILEEVKTIRQHFSHIELRELLQWATFNGAKALQLENKLGSFEVGKKPGIVLIGNAGRDRLSEDAVATRLL